MKICFIFCLNRADFGIVPLPLYISARQSCIIKVLNTLLYRFTNQQGDLNMNKKFKAAMAGLAFVAGCEIGIALQLMKMIRDYTVKEKAANEPLEDAAAKDFEAVKDVPENADDISDTIEAESAADGEDFTAAAAEPV